VEKSLFIIPARGGSKGIPGKNIRPLNDKPLIHYSLEYARQFVPDERICVTTDSNEIAMVVEKANYSVPFIRPLDLAADTSGMYEVLLHAMEFYRSKIDFETIILLQPTSPLRLYKHLQEAWQLYDADTEMVVSVKESEANPYYNLFEEDGNGFLKKSKDAHYNRRQDCPPVYQYNGSLYIINPVALSKYPLSQFSKVKKYIMPSSFSIDLDTEFDWQMTELLLQKSNTI